MICNGGSTTGYQALAAGRPVLGIAANLDQYLAMTAIENAGAGVLLRAGTLTAAAVRRAVTDLLGDVRKQAAARALALGLRRPRRRRRVPPLRRRRDRDRYPGPPGGFSAGGGLPRAWLTARARGAAGKYRLNSAPRPGALCTAMPPWWLFTMPCTTDNPSPVPSPAGLVVNSGSKMRSRVASSMPTPVSVTTSFA